MSDAVSFWLDNKMVSARKVAEIANQTLVDYRGKFYLVVNGSAQMRGSKPLHYSKSSLPALWKKAMRGEVPVMPLDQEDDAMPLPSITRKKRSQSKKEVLPVSDNIDTVPVKSDSRQAGEGDKATRSVKKSEAVKPAAQTSVPAQCPYCNQKHDIPMEKGKNGKPFFMVCSKCSSDFAVRFVPVTLFQAQVAGFRLP